MEREGPADLSGTRLGVYTLQELLGVGEGTVVWLAEGGGRQVAIRIDAREDAADAEQRFARIRQLDHPRLMKVYGAGRTPDGAPYFVCELNEGQPLSEVLNEGAPLPVERAVAITLQVLDALDHAHRSGLLSLAPEPSGVFLGWDDGVKLRPIHGGDGEPIAAQLASIQPHLAAKRLRYMAPERIAAGRGGPPSDVYAAGVMLYHMLTGRAPFEGHSGEALSREHLLSSVPSLNFANPGVQVSGGVAALVDRALAKRPESRFQSAAAMQRALMSVSGIRLPELAVPAPPAPPPPESLGAAPPGRPPLPTPPRNWPWLLLAGLGLVLFAWVVARVAG